jgi:DNA-binding Lrp family transcriptional regulator
MNKAYVMVNCELGSEVQVLEDLKNIECVKTVQGVFGVYDILVNLECERHEDLRQNIIGTIRNIKNVRSTMTLMGIKGQC